MGTAMSTYAYSDVPTPCLTWRQSKGCSELGRLVALTSIDAHYSLKKASMTLGIGSDNLVLVNTDAVGR